MKELLSNNVTWIDITSPTGEDLNILEKELKIPKKIVEQIQKKSSGNKMEFYQDCFYSVLYFPIWDEETKKTNPVELDIIIYKQFIITVKYCELFIPINEFIETCEICNKEEKEEYIGSTTYETFYHIIQTMLSFSRRQLHHIEKKIANLEEDVFDMDASNNNQKLIYSTLTIKRDLLGFKRIFITLQNSLTSIGYKGEEFWGQDAKPYLLDLINDSKRVWNNVEHHYALLESLEETLYTLINNNINALTKIYTIISFIAWPTLLLISWYQTNTNWLPFVGRNYDSYIIFAIALIPSVLIYWYLKRNKLI
jgi:Mg2+ and Co2+ transporter CorA